MARRSILWAVMICLALSAPAALWATEPATAPAVTPDSLPAATPTLSPGLYRLRQGGASCQLRRLPDGSWEILLWQGEGPAASATGFAFVGRMLPAPGGKRLSATWQALPGSCCPGRGRGELEITGPDAFRFLTFLPIGEGTAWPVRPEQEFVKVADLPQRPAGASLAGTWRLHLYYTDLLPDGAPADPVSARLQVRLEGDRLVATWSGWPGQTSLSPTPGGAELRYEDPRAGYHLEASLSRRAGGLALVGSFRSTLGQGRLGLVREGLPAAPPVMERADQNQAAGELAGTWVDPRTGNDFFRLRPAPHGFDFTAYGGSLARPRYLSRGQARQSAPDTWEGRARDVEGYCCGNQGRLRFRRLDRDRLEVRAFWWPLGQPDPGTPVGEPYVIQRVEEAPATPEVPPAPAGRWPLVRPVREGLLAREEGAVRVRFTWQPPAQAPARAHTLFCQGGYQRDLDLFIDAQGRLAARITTDQGELNLTADQPLTPDRPHTAWLIYRAGGSAQLWQDENLAAQVEMPAPWRGSRSPYLVGGSRWPGRSFAGDIERVELFATAQDPTQPGEPTLVITPPPAAAPGEAPPSQEARVVELVRLWHPARLVHAYAADPAEVERLRKRGFVSQGPVAGLLDRPAPGTVALWAFRHRSQGYTLLSTNPTAPPGCDSLGRVGFAWTQPGQDTVPLRELRADFPEPLRGGRSQDVLYTTREDSVASARRAGYGRPHVVAHVRRVEEPAFRAPALYTWSGSWRGEGWGRFFLARRGDTLAMFWYYGNRQSPRYYARYRLSPDGRTATGYAVGRPGPKASYYRHRLVFVLDAPQGPRIRLTSWRLAAPLDDGRLVSFTNPRPTTTVLLKLSQTVDPTDTAELRRAATELDPQALLQAALTRARREGRLLER